jgi:hypothetical protein
MLTVWVLAVAVAQLVYVPWARAATAARLATTTNLRSTADGTTSA